MRNFIAAVFLTEAAAYEGMRVLRRLHGDGTITVYETVVIERQPDGEIVTKQFRQDERPLKRTGIGTILGALAGAFVGPIGIALGGSVGFFGGAMDDAIHSTVSEEYVEHLAAHVQRGSFAVIAEIHETDPTPVDASVAGLGGTVVREKRRELLGDLLEKRAEAHRAAVERDRRQRASDAAERKLLFVEADSHDARDRLKRTAEDARDGLDETRRELDAKLRALDDQLAGARPAVREELAHRIEEIRRDLGERERKLSRALEIANEALHQ